MRKTMTIDFYKQTEGARLVKCSEFGEEVVKNMEP
jgi:isocitrate dehydrogenase